jgi:hypothetical protein
MSPQARQDGLLVQEVGGELVIYDQQRNHIHSLNPTTALVWRHCDGQTSISRIAALLAEERGLAADEDLVWLALEQLQAARLLQEPLPQIGAAARVSRREMIARLKSIGALSFILPVITSITAPSPAMAQYPDVPGCGGDCELDSDCTSTPGSGATCVCESGHCTVAGGPPMPTITCAILGGFCTAPGACFGSNLGSTPDCSGEEICCQ